MAIPALPQLPQWIVYPILAIGIYVAFFYIIVVLSGRDKEPKLRKYRPEVAFVIPARNVEKYIEKTIMHVLRQDYLGKIYAIVVNDASKDNTPDIVEKLMRKFNSKNRKIILINRKKSIDKKAAAVNTGIRYVLKNLKTDILAALDADTFIDKDTIRKALAYFEQDDTVAAVTCPLLPYKPKTLLVGIQKIEYVMSMFFRKLLTKINALCFTPAFTIFKTQFFREAGLYNENTWTEDFDIGLKVKSHFYKVVQIESKAYFIAPTNLKKLNTERVRWAHGTFQALFKDYTYMFSVKYGTLGTFFLPLTMFVGILVLVVAFLLLIYGAISGISWFIHNIGIGWKPILDFSITFFEISVFFSDPRVILGLVAILISILFLIFAKNFTKQKINIFHYILFLIPYSWFLMYTQVEGLIRYLFKLKMVWGHMHIGK